MYSQADVIESLLQDIRTVTDNQIHGLIDGGCRFPMSRDHDLPEIKCTVTGCAACQNYKCIAPALIVIGEDGRCIGSKKTKPKDKK